MTRATGNRKQNILARYLATWWPHAESAGAGRNGSDVLGTPGVVWECKTADDFKRDFRPLEWVTQAKGHVVKGDYDVIAGDFPIMPVVVYFPRGVGEANTGNTLAILPLHTLMRLLQEAGYAPAPKGDQ